eukprot:3938899-Ditylum_brightwellii.AAC.1
MDADLKLARFLPGVKKGSKKGKSKENTPNENTQTKKLNMDYPKQYTKSRDIDLKDKVFWWTVTPPKSRDSDTKVVDGITYYFFCNHAANGVWVKHKPDRCWKNKSKCKDK